MNSGTNWMTSLISVVIDLLTAVFVPSLIWNRTSDVDYISYYFLGCLIGLFVTFCRSSLTRRALSLITRSIRSRRA